MDQTWLVGIGAVATALALGLVPAMTVLIGRIAFQTLPEDEARAFLRAAFPVYYAFLIGFTLLGAAALAMPRPIDASVLAAVGLISLFARLWLMPIAHRLDDLQREGQDMRQELLKIQGRSSFVIVATLIALAVVAIRLAVV